MSKMEGVGHGGEREREGGGGLDKEECGFTYRVMVSCCSLLLCSHSLPWSPFHRRRNRGGRGGRGGTRPPTFRDGGALPPQNPSQ